MPWPQECAWAGAARAGPLPRHSRPLVWRCPRARGRDGQFARRLRDARAELAPWPGAAKSRPSLARCAAAWGRGRCSRRQIALGGLLSVLRRHTERPPGLADCIVAAREVPLAALDPGANCCPPRCRRSTRTARSCRRRTGCAASALCSSSAGWASRAARRAARCRQPVARRTGPRARAGAGDERIATDARTRAGAQRRRRAVARDLFRADASPPRPAPGWGGRRGAQSRQNDRRPSMEARLRRALLPFGAAALQRSEPARLRQIAAGCTLRRRVARRHGVFASATRATSSTSS